jgi:hypothetical protein
MSNAGAHCRESTPLKSDDKILVQSGRHQIEVIDLDQQ